MPRFEKSENWDEIFVGRKAISEKILGAQNNFFIFGARRIGKTSLLKFLEAKFWAKKIPAFYLSIQGYQSGEKIQRKIRNCFKRKKVQFDESLFTDFSFFDFLEELSLKLDRLNSRFVFLIDEAEQIAEIDNNEPGFVDRFRNIAETLENISFVLTASPHFKRVFTQSRCSAFLSAFEVQMLPVMNHEEIIRLMKKMVHDLEHDEIEYILQFTGYQPYLAKIYLGKILLMSHEEIGQVLRKFILDMDFDEVERVLQFSDYQPDLIKMFMGKLWQKNQLQPAMRFIAENIYVTNGLDGIFPNYFEGLTDEDQELVRRIHQRELKSPEEHETKLMQLVQYGYLKHEAERYEVSNWFFKHWMDGEFGKVDDAYPYMEDVCQPEQDGEYTEGEQLPHLTPFYTLRNFLDVEYSGILGYGFYKLAEESVKFITMYRDRLGDSPNVAKMLETFLNTGELHTQFAMITFFIAVFIMLVDDYAFRRIITYLAPCRSITRFSLDVTIGFFFGLAFMFIPEKNMGVWGAVGMAFFLGGLWGGCVRSEGREWKKNPKTADPGMFSKVSNWNLYFARVNFLINSNLLSGLLMIAVMCLQLVSGIDRVWYNWSSLVFFALYLLIEILRYFAEHRLIAKHQARPGVNSDEEVMVTIAYIPYFMKKILKRWARGKK